MKTVAMEKVRVGDIDIAYRWDGRPKEDTSRPLLMMAHALGTDHRIWDKQVPALAKQYRILRYDWRGHGSTDAPPGPYTLAQFEADAIGLMDALQLERVHWVGLSTGGMIGQGLGIHHAERIESLSLCNTMSMASATYREFADFREGIVAREGLRPIWPLTHKMWFSDAYVEAGGPDYQWVRDMFLATPASGYVGGMHAVMNLAYGPELPRIKAPTLVLAASDDPVSSPEHTQAMAEAIPAARYVVLEGLRHYSNVEAADQFNSALNSFLSQRSPGCT
ncbi:MAG: alpha/beta fold hydrolase [Burkholderiaceae bacterium]